MICCKVISTNLTFLRILKVTHFITSHGSIVSQALTWKSWMISLALDLSHLCASISKTHLPPDDLQRTLVKACSNRAGHMAITWFSDGMLYLQNGCRKLTVQNPFWCKLASWLGQGMLFFIKGLDLHAKCSTTITNTESTCKKLHTHHAQSYLLPQKC